MVGQVQLRSTLPIPVPIRTEATRNTSKNTTTISILCTKHKRPCTRKQLAKTLEPAARRPHPSSQSPHDEDGSKQNHLH